MLKWKDKEQTNKHKQKKKKRSNEFKKIMNVEEKK